jgi:hypothetical protein
MDYPSTINCRMNTRIRIKLTNWLIDYLFFTPAQEFSILDLGMFPPFGRNSPTQFQMGFLPNTEWDNFSQMGETYPNQKCLWDIFLPMGIIIL